MFVLVIVSSFFLFKKKEPLDLTKEENWIKVFPNAYPQVDDITPVPGPFEPYRKDGLYTLIEISPLVRFLQLNSGKLQSFACLSLDVTHGEAVVKFLFDRNYYSMQVKRRHGDHYNFVNGSETLGFKLEPDIVFDDGSIGYMIRYEDERYLRGEHYYDNLKTNSGTNSSSHYKNMTECIVSVLEQSVSLNKNSLIEN
ncbi:MULTISPECIES: hypothetical protein [Leptospira]|uniref:hypothetical protein n=1 Tax=Leptospira TaxID=171 RepID=UPI0002BD4EE0|nr:MULTISPECIES: hypothetical protein [Leptospira]EMK03372.1 hypothetical protein LEP1GSC166_0168 [Leptospira kirschneri]KXZ25051.1 hypothetical protein AYB32_17785 [Leptospira kirschneri]KXZ27504.1 hypothetical protein AYB34_17765 [Leptospira sp. ZV016]